MEIHQALTGFSSIINHLLHHKQGEVFAAFSYACSTSCPGVCIATFSPNATNLISGLADVLLDSIPIVAITGQVFHCMIGTDAFQETPSSIAIRAKRLLVKGCEGFLVTILDTQDKKLKLEDIPVVKEFFDIFSDDLLGLPPDREIEFSIDLISGTSPISKAPY
uniref:Acetolactate synthase 2, chloroplastic-like n=1 Tax=Elaeis guineensis var. tenera TaxID=51953 RepID=A0A6I9QT44_ELAGV|nr:acetolactate synthase 2, chloroplastic-like [Elaeis guineensis]